MQGSATQSAPKAVHSGSRSGRPRANQKTMPAPRRANPMAKLRVVSVAGAIAARTTPTGTIPVAPKRPRRHSRPHSHAITAPASAVSKGSQGDPNQIAAIGNGASATADRTRGRSEPYSVRANRRTVPTLPAAEFVDRLFQVALGEIGPQGLGEDQLGIGALPEQKVADALLATGADQQVRVRNIRGEKMTGDAILVDFLGGKRPARRLCRDRAHRCNNFSAPAIGKGNRQSASGIVAGQ